MKISDKDRNRPAKHYQVTGYLLKTLKNINNFALIEVFYQNFNFCEFLFFFFAFFLLFFYQGASLFGYL